MAEFIKVDALGDACPLPVVKAKKAISELQATVADTSVDVAARLIGEDLTEGEHRAIIERYVKEAGSFNGN